MYKDEKDEINVEDRLQSMHISSNARRKLVSSGNQLQWETYKQLYKRLDA